MKKQELDYEIKMYTIETTNGIEYVAEIPELKGCIGSGISYTEALEEVLENKEVYLETLIELKKPIPTPMSAQTKYSGRFSVRISPRLHQKVAKISEEYGISINQFIVETLSEAVGSNLKLINMTKERIKRQEEIILKDSRDDFLKKDYIFPKKIERLN